MTPLLNELLTWGKGLKVLYVEDDISLREELSILLSDIFDVVECASNGQEGLEKIAQVDYDLIITDINMPKINGIEMIKKLQEINPELPVVVFSAHNEVEYLVQLIHLRVENFLAKPIRAEQVFNVLHKVVERIHSAKELLRYKEELEIANDKLKNIISTQAQSIDFKTSMLKSYKDAIYEVNLVSITTPDGTIKEVNDNFCDVFGYTRDEIIGHTHSMFGHRETPTQVYAELWDTILSKHIWHGMLTNQTKTFTSIYHYTTIIPVLDAHGEIYEFLAVKQDLTKLEEANQCKLIESINSTATIKQDEILKLVPFASVIFDSKSKILHFNKQFEDFVLALDEAQPFITLLSDTLHMDDILNFKDLASIKDTDFIDAMCDINGIFTVEATAQAVRQDRDICLKIKKLDDLLYMGCLIVKEDVETCFLVQEN